LLIDLSDRAEGADLSAGDLSLTAVNACVVKARAMRGTTHFLPLGLAVAALALMAAEQVPSLGQAQAGLWEISGLPGAKAPVRQCVADIAMLARFEHRAKSCTAKVLKSSGSMTAVEYSCGGAGFGHSDIEVITPRSLRINTQGISDGLPFNYVLQARRVDDCPQSTSVIRH
jgi:hypothetical protein